MDHDERFLSLRQSTRRKTFDSLRRKLMRNKRSSNVMNAMINNMMMTIMEEMKKIYVEGTSSAVLECNMAMTVVKVTMDVVANTDH